jgi:large subunit ribosomal protein L23
MALFGRNKKEEKPVKGGPVSGGKEAEAQAVSLSLDMPTRSDFSHILKHPRITEKATMHQATSVYTFDVAERATKRDIIAAVRAIYKVTPRKVAIITVPSKARRSMRTGMRGVSKGGKKAYVFLKKGETITIA